MHTLHGIPVGMFSAIHAACVSLCHLSSVDRKCAFMFSLALRIKMMNSPKQREDSGGTANRRSFQTRDNPLTKASRASPAVTDALGGAAGERGEGTETRVRLPLC